MKTQSRNTSTFHKLGTGLLFVRTPNRISIRKRDNFLFSWSCPQRVWAQPSGFRWLLDEGCWMLLLVRLGKLQVYSRPTYVFTACCLIRHRARSASVGNISWRDDPRRFGNGLCWSLGRRYRISWPRKGQGFCLRYAFGPWCVWSKWFWVT
jgi:hypothetical protein